jgi:septal ring factor EnvC (AmiA/AmiB activator)
MGPISEEIDFWEQEVESLEKERSDLADKYEATEDKIWALDEEIKKHIVENGISRKQLAKALGILESGADNVMAKSWDMNKCFQVAEVLNLNPRVYLEKS